MRFLFFIFAFPFFLFAEWDQLFQGDSNPSCVHHVNVISGNLQLFFQDQCVSGAVPIYLTRNYSSKGIEECKHNKDLDLKSLQLTWQAEMGWDFFPELQLLVDPRKNTTTSLKAYLKESSGEMVSYAFSHEESEDVVALKPTNKTNRTFGFISARTNPNNNLLHINYKTGDAILYLANGGKRIYKGEERTLLDKISDYHIYQHPRKLRYYLLQKEILPSGQKKLFRFDRDGARVTISHTNLSETRVYSYVCFEKSNKDPPFSIHMQTSDYRFLTYKIEKEGKQEYLSFVDNGLSPPETIFYTPTQKNLGNALHRITSLNKPQLFVEYYTDTNTFETNKVKTIYNQNTVVAHFTYFPNITEVRDANQVLTRYHHENDKLLSIEYFDELGTLYSSQKFFWNNEDLIAKSMCDQYGHPIFSKTLTYDEFGNVVEETLYGNLTGENEGPFSLTETGALTGSDSYTKFYEYDPTTFLTLEEKESSGLTTRFTYIPNTDLIDAKETYQDGILLTSQTRLYDDDNLLIKEIFEDEGFSFEKTYTRDPLSGRVIAIEECGKKVAYEYSIHNEILQEHIYDERGDHRYSIEYKYDDKNHLTYKSTPYGLENHYAYNEWGDLIKSKEVGCPLQTFTYDANRRLQTATKNKKTTHFTYTKKGLLDSETNHLGETTTHTYDAFGKEIKTTFPEILDEHGSPYRPTIEFAYDLLGNCIFEKNAKNETKRTSYNLFGNPTKEILPDQSVIRHIYNINGTLKKTIHQDNSTTTYEYNPLQRITSKKTPFGEETWVYIGSQVVLHTTQDGLTTTYNYDPLGRLIQESTLGRTKTYTYDPLGYLETTTSGPIKHTQIHDLEGKIIKEDLNQENITTYEYNTENQKVRIKKITSQGEAIDQITYDLDGNLVSHIDPNQATTRISYKDRTKITIDPLQNRRIETYDALNHLIRVEHQNLEQKPISIEENFYDPSGNLAKKITYIYEDDTLKGTSQVLWENNFRGQIVKETQGTKVTQYRYDPLGRIVEKTLPNKVKLTTSYDKKGRICTLISSDGTIHYQYHYELGVNPIRIEDKVYNTSITRRYNKFGELLEENTNTNLTLSYEYDNHGREKSLTLPDKSKITYEYDKHHLKEIHRISSKGSLLYKHTYNTFDPNGHVCKETLIQNIGTITTTHDLLERPQTITSPLHRLSQSFDPAGRVAYVENSICGSKYYEYDSLHQLIEETDLKYHFNSLGTPCDEPTNEYQQLTSQFEYDQNGNPTKRLSDNTLYTYDALGRLTSIKTTDKTTSFQYDAYSRLQSKTTLHNNGSKEKRLYLYHKDNEIGSLTEDLKLMELKILGLGISHDIGAAIAIELENEPYAPLHDFQGNIIALIGSDDGEIASTYTYTAFGEADPTPSKNPWRLASKRTEETLVYFNNRFYDPKTKRWLTPDPLGLSESVNVYIYNLNSPLNRLDALGLFSISYQKGEGIYFDPTDRSPQSCNPNQQQLGPYIKGVAIPPAHTNHPTFDCIIICEQIYNLPFTPEEITNKSANLLDYVPLLTPKESGVFGITSAQNGINTTAEEFLQNCFSITNNIPEGTLFIGAYNPTTSLYEDTKRAKTELKGLQTQNSLATADFLSLISDTLIKSNSKSLWLHIPHSEAGVLFNLAFHDLNPDQKHLLQNQLHVFALAPAQPVPFKPYCSATNAYSVNDDITGPLAFFYLFNPDYYIKPLKCESSWNQLSAYFADHSFLGNTYQKALRDEIQTLRLEHGFYDPKKR